MFKALVVHLCLLICCLHLAGCIFPNPHASLRHQIDTNRLADGPPSPLALTPGIPQQGRVVLDPVRIEPEKMAGYASIPTSITRIYDAPPRDLSQADVVVQEIANDRQVKIEEFNVRIAEYQVPVAKSIYDLLLSGFYQYQRTERQSGLPPQFSVVRSRSKSGELALSQLLPTGATLSAAYDANQSATNNYSNRTTLRVNQPLLQGLGWTVTNANIHIALLQSQGTLADYEAQLEDQLQSALNTYWNLVGAIQALKVQVISYAAARDLMRANQARFDVGLLSLPDLLQTQAAMDARYDQIIQARSAVRSVEDQLKRQILLTPDHPLWPAELRPTVPIAWRETPLDMDAVVAQAMRYRPELLRAQSNVESARVSLRVARNNLLPVLDFFGDIIPNGRGTGFDEGVRNMDSGKATSYDLGVQFSYPLQNRAARYRYKQAQASLEQSEEQLKDTQDQVTQDVRAAVRAYQIALDQIRATQASVVSQQANVDTEIMRLNVGLSTTFRVLSFQSDLATAQLQHVRAVIKANQASIDLERARGTLLETYGVHVDAAQYSAQSGAAAQPAPPAGTQPAAPANAQNPGVPVENGMGANGKPAQPAAPAMPTGPQAPSVPYEETQPVPAKQDQGGLIGTVKE